MANDDNGQVPAWVSPMLAKPDGGRLPAEPGLVYETKLDGYRACMRIAADGTTVLTTRNGKDATSEFAELTTALAPALGGRPAVLDGEIVVYDEQGHPDFSLMQERRGRFVSHSHSRRRTEPFEDVLKPRFLAFDLLRLGDRHLIDQSYEERRRLLTGLEMPDPYRVAVVDSVTFEELAADRRTPEDWLDLIAAAGHEGLIAKVRTSTYQPGRRSDAWRKHPLVQTTEVILCGWRPGQGRMTGRLGGLLLGAHDRDTGDLVYIGDVGTGFSDAERSRLQQRLEQLERGTHPFALTPPRDDTRRARWLRPVLVGEVVFRQFTRGDGRLRHTAWRGLREDHAPEEVLVPERRHRRTKPTAPPSPSQDLDVPDTGERAAAPAESRVTVQAAGRRLTLSNMDKVLYPSTGFTKGAVINYYSHIAPVMLPHLAGRPVTFIRFPDGVDNQQFFEKNVPNGAPEWLPTVRLPSTGSRSKRGPGVIDYTLIDELPALVWAANMAALELHIPQWKIDTGTPPGRGMPDRLVFDLDPGPGTSIVECCRVAERLRDVLVRDGLTVFAKTSGSKGMQLYCAVTVDTAAAPSAYAKRLAQQLAQETPDTVTAIMTKANRTGKVFIDWSQNNPAKTTIAPYSLRGRGQPTVSTPITWNEIGNCTRPEHLTYTADDVLDRVTQLGDLLTHLTHTSTPLPTN